MRFTAAYLAPLLVATAAAVAITVSPTASASPLACTDVGSAVQCGSPGNSQITAVPPYIQQPQQIIIIHRGRR